MSNGKELQNLLFMSSIETTRYTLKKQNPSYWRTQLHLFSKSVNIIYTANMKAMEMRM